MATPEATITTKAKDYRGWILLAVFGFVVVVILGIAVAAFAFYRLQSANSATALPQDSILAINTATPEAAATEFNQKLVKAVESVNSNDPEAALNALMTSLVGAQTNTDSAKFAITYSANDGKYTNSLDFQGDVKRNPDGTTNLQGSANLKIQSAQISNLTLPIDLIVINQVAYIKVNSTTGNVPADYAPFLELFKGKWVKLDLSQYITQAQTQTQNDLTDPAKRQEAIERLKQNPLLLNAKQAPNRVVNGDTLQCMTADVNPQAFDTDAKPVAAQPLEICSANGNAPVYFGSNLSENGEDMTVGVTFLSFGAPTTIVAPTEDVVDFSSMFGGSGI